MKKFYVILVILARTQPILSPLFRIFHKIDPKFEPEAELYPDLVVRKSGILNAGNGLYTTKLIKKGEIVCECHGELLPSWKIFFLAEADHLMFLKWSLLILPYKNDKVQMINHKPHNKPANVMYDRQPDKKKLIVKAIVDIYPDEEIFGTYTDLHKKVFKWG